MASGKLNLLDAIRALPEGYAEFLDRALPSKPAMPADVDDAQMKVGQCAEYISNILDTFAGLHVLKVPYLMGQGNEAVLGLLLASLQVNTETGDFEIIEPVTGLSYAQGENSVSICILNGTASNISCTVYPPIAPGSVIAEFEEVESGVWLAPIDYTEAGTWSVTCIVRFGDALQVKETTAEVT